nr:hypothetical protein [Tanacetum cinerariifolium]
FWSTAMAKTINEEVQLHAQVDGKEIVNTKSCVRRDLQLADEEGIDCLPNSTIFEQLALMGLGKGFSGKVTPLFQTMVQQLGEDKAVHKELGDRLVKAATTASSLEVEQDSGNITKTQSKATPNESSSQGTNSGGGPRVLDLEKTKTTKFNEIASLKRRVKKLEKRNRSRTHGLKRLYKVGLSARVESYGDEESLGEDASKQGRMIDAIDADEKITLVNVHDDVVSNDADKEMFDVDDLGGEEVFVAGKNKNVVEEVVNAAQVSKSKTTISSQQSHDKGKGIMIEEPMKPKKKDQIRLDEEAVKKLQAEFDEEERLRREKAEKEERANIALIEE